MPKFDESIGELGLKGEPRTQWTAEAREKRGPGDVVLVRINVVTNDDQVRAFVISVVPRRRRRLRGDAIFAEDDEIGNGDAEVVYPVTRHRQVFGFAMGAVHEHAASKQRPNSNRQDR